MIWLINVVPIMQPTFIWVILLKPGHYCDNEVENLKFDILYFLYWR